MLNRRSNQGNANRNFTMFNHQLDKKKFFKYQVLVRVYGNGHAPVTANGGVVTGVVTLESDLMVSIRNGKCAYYITQ